MQIVVLDFETYYTKGFELKGMMDYPDGLKRRSTTEAYIRDPRFDPICCCLYFPESGATVQLKKLDISTGLAALPWSDIIVLCHHAQFDGLILSHHYGHRPKVWLDTYSMASVILGNHIKVGLDSLCSHYGLPAKTVPYNLFRGKRFEELDAYTLQQVMNGCSDDCLRTWEVFNKLLLDYTIAAGKGEVFPTSEIELIDKTIRWFTEPKLVGDIELLAEIWQEERRSKADALAEIGATIQDVRSDKNLIALFEAEGVEVAYKPGKNGNMIPCFAATDDWLREMQDADDPRVAALADARVSVKSNAVQSRADTLGWMASRGHLCIYLRYGAAHTTRWGGGDGSNFQNNKRGHRIRHATVAPDGFFLAAPDSSQIECRLLNTLAGQWDVVERFRTGADPYVALASAIYGRGITKSDIAERGAGKQGELSCGYMAGAATFQRTAAKGAYGPPAKITREFAQYCVDTYRNTHLAIAGPRGYWYQAGEMLKHLDAGSNLMWGPLEIRNHRIWLPNGLPLIYDTLKWHVDLENGDSHWRLLTRRGWTKMYSGRLVENVVQALARVKIAEDILEIGKELDTVGMSHDEVWVLIPEGPDADEALKWCEQVMARPASWLPQCPFAAEGKMGKAYPK